MSIGATPTVQLGMGGDILLRMKLRQSVRSGQLDRSALALPHNQDAWDSICEGIMAKATADGVPADSLTAAATGGGRLQAVFQWLVANWPAILEMIKSIMALYGGTVAVAAMAPTMFTREIGVPPTAMLIPPGLIALGQQVLTIFQPYIDQEIAVLKSELLAWLQAHTAPAAAA